MDHRNSFAEDSLPGGTFRGPPEQLCGRFLARWYIPWTTRMALRAIPCPVVHLMDHRDRRTQSYTPAWIKTRIFSPATEPECPFGIVSGIIDPVWVSDDPFGIVFGIFDPVWVSGYPFGIVFGIFDPVWAPGYPFGIGSGIFDPVDMTESHSRGWLVRVRKQYGDRRRKSPLYALQWRGIPSKNLTSAILSETGANILALNSREDDVGVLT